MTITTSTLTKAAGAAAVAAGAIFIAVQINHPSAEAYVTDTTEWVVRSFAKMVMSALVLVAITGMYLRQVRRVGVLGLVGYLVFAIGYLTMFGVETLGALVLPGLTHTEPGYVTDVVVAASGGTAQGDIGHLQVLFNLSGAAYMVGGLLFGIALFRARVLARWAAALLAVSTVATAALAVLPQSFSRPFAVPEAIALIGLGVSLWRNHQGVSASAQAVTAGARPEPAVR